MSLVGYRLQSRTKRSSATPLLLILLVSAALPEHLWAQDEETVLNSIESRLKVCEQEVGVGHIDEGNNGDLLFQRVSDLETFESQTSGLDTRIEDLESGTVGLGTRIKKLESGIVGLGTRIEELESSIVGFDTRITNLRTAFAESSSDLDTRITDLNQDLNKLDEALKSKTGELVTRIGELNEAFKIRVDTLDDRLDDLQESFSSSIDDLSPRITTLEHDTNTLVNRVTDLEGAVADLGESQRQFSLTQEKILKRLGLDSTALAATEVTEPTMSASLSKLGTFVFGDQVTSAEEALPQNPTSEGLVGDVRQIRNRLDEYRYALYVSFALLFILAIYALLGRSVKGGADWMVVPDSGDVPSHEVEKDLKDIKNSIRHILSLQKSSIEWQKVASDHEEPVGRQKELAKLSDEMLTTRRGFFLHGASGSGKTFLLKSLQKSWRVNHGINVPLLLPVYLDLGSSTVNRSFFRHLYEEFKQSVDSFVEETGQEFLDVEELAQLPEKGSPITERAFMKNLLLFSSSVRRDKETGAHRVCCVFMLDNLDTVVDMEEEARDGVVALLEVFKGDNRQACRVLGTGSRSWDQTWGNQSPPIQLTEVALPNLSVKAVESLVNEVYPYLHYWKDCGIKQLHRSSRGVPREARFLASQVTQSALDGFVLQIDHRFVRQVCNWDS